MREVGGWEEEIRGSRVGRRMGLVEVRDKG
jgi:hypothetical protein